MKNVFLTLVILQYCIISFAQTNISIKEMEVCTWSTNYQDWINCTGYVYDNSLFTINKVESQIMHKHKKGTTTYYVNKKWRDGDQFLYMVVSDIGNKYTIIVDFEHDLFKMVTETSSGSYLSKYDIKAVF